MPDEPTTDPAAVVPPAAPLTGESAEPDHPDPSEVFPIGDAGDNSNLVSDDDA